MIEYRIVWQEDGKWVSREFGTDMESAWSFCEERQRQTANFQQRRVGTHHWLGQAPVGLVRRETSELL